MVGKRDLKSVLLRFGKDFVYRHRLLQIDHGTPFAVHSVFFAFVVLQTNVAQRGALLQDNPPLLPFL
jgi:hypothetical protein